MLASTHENVQDTKGVGEKNSIWNVENYWDKEQQSKARNLDSKYRQMALVGFDIQQYLELGNQVSPENVA